MYVKQYCLILLLASICGSSVGTETNVDVAVNSDNAKPCVSDSDCLHSGRCEQRYTDRFCKCKEGTFGDFCDKVYECVKNPGKCGTLDDVACVYDEQKEEAMCKCENETKTFVEEEGRCMNPCVSDSDCLNSGSCESRSGGKFCKCKNGTSGDFCDRVDECVDNLEKCGTRDDVACIYDVVEEKAVCKCANTSKTFVEDEGKCMSPCLLGSICGEYGVCHYKVGNQKFCACQLGASGDYCEIIDQCHNKTVDCGEDNNATCKLNPDGSAFCKCEDETKGFDYDQKLCRGCEECGENAFEPRYCTFEDGRRICSCKRYYSSDEGICEDCKCGQDALGCKFENGTKTCQCWSGTAQKDGKCQKCDCGGGLGVSKCVFKDGKKVCSCKEGYALDNSNGPCKQMCNATNNCANGGKCVQNVCKCLKGTSGDLCEIVNDCRFNLKCGDAKCLYNETSQMSYCKCDGSLVFDDYYEKCKECSCGSFTRSCTYVNGKKKCTCSDAYSDRLGKCEVCFCKGYSSMYNCKFDDSGHIKCPCLKGYAQNGYEAECKECNCGDHGKCTITRWPSKYCTCDDGYAESNGKCEKCDCGKYGYCYIYGGKKSCSCNVGYKEYKGTCKACQCGLNAECGFRELGIPLCTCNSGYGMKQGICEPCECYPGDSCIFKTASFINENKVCICPKGYANDQGKCRECDCKAVGSNCTYYTGFNRCECPEGFQEQYKTTTTMYCAKINKCRDSNPCPTFSTNCENKPEGKYECHCKDGFEPNYPYGGSIENDGCKDIDECERNYKPCNDEDAKCVNTPGSYKCECKHGYIYKATEEKRNVCHVGSSGMRPWRTASIIVGICAAVVIIGLIIAVYTKHNT